MLSKVDISDTKLIDGYKNAYSSDILSTLFSRAFDWAGFDGIQLFPGKNYCKEKKNVMRILNVPL